MRLLDRYLLRELLVPFGYCLGGFLIFWTAFDIRQLELEPLERAQFVEDVERGPEDQETAQAIAERYQ